MMMQLKHEWRTKMKAQLGEISAEEREHLDNKVLEQLVTYQPYLNAGTIGLTVAMKHEINTTKIIERAWNDGKKVAVPKCHPESKQMIFHYLTNWNQLETVYFGLKEPKEEETPVCPNREIDLLLVPGLIFDRKGFRIGFGGGYYDRYLQEYSNETVSLAYEIQLVEAVPVESFDIPVQTIISNERIVTVK